MPPPAHGLASRLIAGPTLRAQSDRRLVRLVREGYEAAFEEIVHRYGSQLKRYAGAIVGPRSEDVTQDAFSKALLALRRDGNEIELRPWLYRIVRNTALNDLRDRPPEPAKLAEAFAGGATPEQVVAQREELGTLLTRLRALPDAQRAAIVMRELEGLGHEEIAAALGLSGGAARQAIHRARRALRDAAGLLVPLPLLRLLLAADGHAAAEAATGAAGLAGAGLAVKATAATVLVAGTVGAGVALQETRDPKAPDGTAREAAPHRADTGDSAAFLPEQGGTEDSSGPGGSNSGPGGGSDESGNEGPGGDDRGDGGQGPSDRSGDGSGEGRSGSGISGSDSEISGSGSSGISGSSGSGSSGSSDDFEGDGEG